MSSSPHRALGSIALSIAAVLGIIGVLIAIGVHPANERLSAPPASEQETARQQVAVIAARISASAAQTGDTDLAKRAKAWEQAAGNVWVPWPSGAPSGYTNPAEPTAAAPNAVVADLGQLRDAALHGADVARSPETGEAFRSIALAASLRLAKGAQVQASPRGAVPVIAACGSSNAQAVAKALNDENVAHLDTALQWFEAAAASGEGDAEQAAVRNAALEAVIEQALEARPKDPRTPFAPLPSERPLSGAALSELYSALLSSNAPAKDSVALACALTTSDSERDQAQPLPGVSVEAKN